MLLFLFLQAEINVIDSKLKALEENQKNVKRCITGEEEESAADRMKKDIRSNTKKNEPSHYNSAKISIAQGGLPPSNDTTAADMLEIHESSKQPDRPMIVACGNTDVFEKSNRLREPGAIT
jgi:hypothetical protein